MRLLAAFVTVSAAGGVLTAGLVMPAVGATGAVAREGVDLFEGIKADLGDDTLSQASTILYADGTVMARVYEQNRVVVPLEAISPAMQQAIIAIEDSRFYEHGPVDLKGIGRAVVNNAAGDGGTQGASTLTQQYVKNVLVEQAAARGDKEAIAEATASRGTKGYARKLREMKMAIDVEKEMSKDEILNGYLNIAYFANHVYGVEAASRFYFSKPAAELTVPEAAVLAGLVKNPVEYDPVKNPEDSVARRNVVLKRMRDTGHLDAQQYLDAVNSPLELRLSPVYQGCLNAHSAAYFCDYVTRIVKNDPAFGKTVEDRQKLLRRGGLTIRTTLDPRVQGIAQEAVDRHVNPGQPVRTAVPVVQPRTGHILAMAQNTRWSPEEHLPGVTTVNYNVDQEFGGGVGFPTGSTYKVFTLATWLKSGKSLDSVVNAPPKLVTGQKEFTACGQKTGDPKDFNNAGSESQKNGRMTVRDATRNSINTAYMNMARQLDLCEIARTAESLGVHKGSPDVKNGVRGSEKTTALDDHLPAAVLGTQSIAPLTMASAYAAFAAEGLYCKPVAVLEVRDSAGNPLPVPGPQCTQALDPNVARNVNEALQGVWSGTAARVSKPGRPAAGKTGTTNESTNTWFAGYTPYLAAAVWVGHHEGETTLNRETINGKRYHRVYGSTIAAPTWVDVVRPASEVLGLPSDGFVPGTDRGLTTINPDGAARVPNVAGRSVASAKATLEAAGFEVVVSSKRVASEKIKAGNVAQTSPGGGRSADTGDTVVLIRSSGPAPKPAPKPKPTAEPPAEPAPPAPAPAPATLADEG